MVSIVFVFPEAVRAPRPHEAAVTYLWYGVPQGSVLGPFLFVLCTVGLILVIESHGLLPHMYADGVQSEWLMSTGC